MFNKLFKIFATPFCKATPACLLVMTQGNIFAATIGHLHKALETGFITGLGVLIFSFFSHQWLRNKFFVATITGAMCFIADLLTHPTHFGIYTTEALVTGIFTALISLTANYIGGRLFIHGRAKLTKGK